MRNPDAGNATEKMVKRRFRMWEKDVITQFNKQPGKEGKVCVETPIFHIPSVLEVMERFLVFEALPIVTRISNKRFYRPDIVE